MKPLEIYQHLNRSNCGDCRVKTCFAFASLVSQQQKKITECPHLPSGVAERFFTETKLRKSPEEEQLEKLAQLEKQLGRVDLEGVAGKLKARFTAGKLVITCLGKNVFIGSNGHISAEIHTHAWIKIPVINYVLMASEKELSGRWVIFKQLPHGNRWNPLYIQRCENPLLKIADEFTDLFIQVLSLFGTRVDINGIEAEQTFLLYPLPKLPLLIGYSPAEEDFEPTLMYYYDERSEDILNINSIYMLAAGISTMVEKIIKKHGGKIIF